MKVKYFILYSFLFISTSGFSQKNFWTISGSVLNLKKKPVQFASIFVNNTSIGTITNENGSFQLSIPNKFYQVELIIYFKESKILKRKINYSVEVQVFRFQLEDVNEAIVSVKNDTEREKKWKSFEKILLGDSKFAKYCKILNPNAVKLDYDKEKNLVATAGEPIIIKNNALGYKISYHIDNVFSGGSMNYAPGIKFFEKLEADNVSLKTRWDKNRKDVFKDSFRSFLLALSTNRLAENNFEVYKISVAKKMDYDPVAISNAIKDSSIIATNAAEIFIYDKDSETFTIQSDFPLLVVNKKSYQAKTTSINYPYGYAEIVLPRGYADFTENGVLRKPNDIILNGLWAYNGLANILPDDYAIEVLQNDSIPPKSISKIER